MTEGLISILMGIYNCADTLPQAIDSVLAQTYTDWELILCDDCSTDNTYEIAESYRQQYPEKIKLVKNEKNSHLAFTLNHCLQNATGEFSVRMDGDDYIAPDKFEKQVAFLRSHPEFTLVGTLMQSFNGDELGRVITYKEFPDKYDLRFGPCFAHASIMMYTEAYNALGGYTVSKRTVRAQDYDLWFRFMAKGYRGTNMQEPLYFVRENGDSFMRRKAKMYFWVMITRWKGFRLLHYPLKYYPYVLLPMVAMAGNEVRKMKVRITRLFHGGKKD